MAHAPGDKPGGLVTVLTFSHVAFRYDTVAPEVFHDLSAAFPPGWTGVVGANGAGKTTLLRLALGELVPRCGTVRGPARRGWCPQRVETEPEALEAFLGAQDRTAARLRGILELEPSELRRWHILSPGERKRAQIAVALWEDPEVLLLDEPTNHVDASVRALLERALGTFRGVGLLVSHDRGLLDALTTQCLFLDPPQGALVPGNYSAASKVREETRQAAEGAFQIQRREVRRLEEAERRRKAEARSADRRCTKRHLAKGDADGRARMDLIRVSGKDGQAGRLQRQMEGRIRQSREVLEVLAVRKTPPLRFWLSGARSSRNRILDLPGFSLPLERIERLTFPVFPWGLRTGWPWWDLTARENPPCWALSGIAGTSPRTGCSFFLKNSPPKRNGPCSVPFEAFHRSAGASWARWCAAWGPTRRKFLPEAPPRRESSGRSSSPWGCWNNPICSCWTSPRTIWTSPPWSSWRTPWPRAPVLCWW